MNSDEQNMDGFGSDDFLSELLSRFEQMLKQQGSSFFDADELVDLIDYYLINGQLSFAARALEIALNQYPENKEIVVSQARYLHAKGRSAKALQILKDLHTSDPDHVDILISMGEIYNDTEKYQKAVNCFEQALQLVDEEEKAVVLDQIVEVLDRMGHHHKMIPYLKQLLVIRPGQPDTLLGLAYCFSILERQEEGIQFFTKLSDEEPFNVNAWFNLGNLYYSIGLYEKAIEAYEFVLAIDPGYTSASLKIGTALSSLERDDESIKIYLDLIKKGVKDAIVYQYLGYGYSQKKNYRRAVHYYEKALEIDPEMPEVHLGLVYAWAGIDNFEAALREMVKVLTVYDEVDELWFYRAYLEEQLAMYEEAMDSLKQGLLINPADISAILSLSNMYIEYFDDFEKATQVLTEALDKLPSEVSLMYRIAAVCFESGLENEGSQWLHNALSTSPESYELMFDYNPLLSGNPAILAILNAYIK